MKVVIEVLAAPAMLGETCHAWMALAIMADATEVASSLIGEEEPICRIPPLAASFHRPVKRGVRPSRIAACPSAMSLVDSSALRSASESSRAAVKPAR
jgi:hypothetical protein